MKRVCSVYTHYLSIPLYTNSCSESFSRQTLYFIYLSLSRTESEDLEDEDEIRDLTDNNALDSDIRNTINDNNKL